MKKGVFFLLFWAWMCPVWAVVEKEIEELFLEFLRQQVN